MQSIARNLKLIQWSPYILGDFEVQHQGNKTKLSENDPILWTIIVNKKENADFFDLPRAECPRRSKIKGAEISFK